MAIESQVSMMINREAALERVGGDEELLAEIAKLFLEDYPGILAEIQSAIQSANARELEYAAHSLKGSVANFGADATREASFELEKIGRAQDLHRAPAAYEVLAQSLALLRPELEALCQR